MFATCEILLTTLCACALLYAYPVSDCITFTDTKEYNNNKQLRRIKELQAHVVQLRNEKNKVKSTVSDLRESMAVVFTSCTSEIQVSRDTELSTDCNMCTAVVVNIVFFAFHCCID